MVDSNLRFLRLQPVESATGLANTTIYARIGKGGILRLSYLAQVRSRPSLARTISLIRLLRV
jgi:hypothetical protein